MYSCTSATRGTLQRGSTHYLTSTPPMDMSHTLALGSAFSVSRVATILGHTDLPSPYSGVCLRIDVRVYTAESHVYTAPTCILVWPEIGS